MAQINVLGGAIMHFALKLLILQHINQNNQCNELLEEHRLYFVFLFQILLWIVDLTRILVNIFRDFCSLGKYQEQYKGRFLF